MPWVVRYHTVVSHSPLKDESALDHLGQEGWRLGGVVQTKKRQGGLGIGGPAVYSDVYHYHFWKEVYRWSDGHESEPRPARGR